MSWLDWGVVIVVALSLLVGLFRGFVREVIGLAGWIVAGIVATWYAEPVSASLPAAVTEPVLRWGIAFILVFLGVLVLAGIVAIVVRRLMHAAGLGLTDRMLGGAFGAVRGVAILIVAVLLLGLTPLRDDPVWRESQFVPALKQVAALVMPYVPDSVRERFGSALVLQSPGGVAAPVVEVSGATADRVVRRSP